MINPNKASFARHLWSALPLTLSVTALACSGKRFTALDQYSGIPAESSSFVNTSLDVSTGHQPSDRTDLPSMTVNPDGGNLETSSSPSDVGTSATSVPLNDAELQTDVGSITGDAALSVDTSAAPPDASVIDTTNTLDLTPDASLDAGLPKPVPTHPCNEGTFENPREVDGLEWTNDLWGPGISADGKFLYFGHTEGDEDLFVAEILGADPARFHATEPLTELNTRTSEGTPFVTADGLAIYFYATRDGGPGDRDLWHASRPTTVDAFDHPALVAGANDREYDHLPWLSIDELTLCFTTRRDDGLGKSDIWTASRASKDEPFGKHKLLPGLNSEAREDAVAFSPDGLTVFFSTDRDTGADLDIWFAVRGSIEDDFSEPKIVEGMNSTAEDTNISLTGDGHHLYFSSGRSGEQRIWVASRTCDAPE
jgi:hypothetical protein